MTLVVLWHFKEEARKEQDEIAGFTSLSESESCMSFEEKVTGSVKVNRLELETLLMERAIFTEKIQEEYDEVKKV